MADVSFRVLVVDDDPGVLHVLERGLRQLNFDVQTALSASAGLKLALERVPDVAVVDVSMPEIDGIELCGLLRQLDPRLPIVFLTARDAPADEVRGLTAGADDYITKPFNMAVLAARLRSLLRRRSDGHADTISHGDLMVDVAARTVRQGSIELHLSATEFSVLLVLLNNAGQVLTKEQILDLVWGYDFGGGINIVEVYVGALRRKLEASGGPRLIETVRGVGYRVRTA